MHGVLLLNNGSCRAPTFENQDMAPESCRDVCRTSILHTYYNSIGIVGQHQEEPGPGTSVFSGSDSLGK